jgi:septum formation protein
MEIILGSQSPRRRELMAGLDLPFTAINIDADETYPAELQAGDIPYYISRAKARAYEKQLKQDQLLITADTIVWLDGHMLGKPHSEEEAVMMLKSLRNRTHQVYTAVTFAQKLSTFDFRLSTLVDCTDVTFGDLSDEEIVQYVQKYRPLDKAGAYGVQEWIGYVACTSMKGSYFNVMGFPVHLVYQTLKQML